MIDEATIVKEIPYANGIAVAVARSCLNFQSEDLKGAAMLGLVEAAQRYRPGRNCSFRSFSARTILFRIKDFMRASAPGGRHEGRMEQLPEGFDMLGEDKPYCEMAAFVVEALEVLTPRERKLILLRFFAELDFSAIGRCLQLSEPRVWQIHREALGKMREALGAYGIHSVGDVL